MDKLEEIGVNLQDLYMFLDKIVEIYATAKTKEDLCIAISCRRFEFKEMKKLLGDTIYLKNCLGD